MKTSKTKKNKETCFNCGSPATSRRITQFSGTHAFCKKCKFEQPDYHEPKKHNVYWEEG